MSPEWRCPLNGSVPKETFHCTQITYKWFEIRSLFGKDGSPCENSSLKTRLLATGAGFILSQGDEFED